MKKRAISFFLATLTAASLNTAVVCAATPVTVELNGQALRFKDAQPQILDGRTMVPIRETAEFLGMTTEWDTASSTMAFTSKDNRIITHTLNQNTIIVNGQVKTFDTPSAVVNDRSLMPVRMLAEAIDAQVEWDASNYKVTITKKSNPAILTIVPEKETVKENGSLSVRVLANTDTTSVKLTDGRQSILGTATTFIESGGVRIFTVDLKPTSTNDSEFMVLAFAGSDAGFNVAPDKNFTLTVEKTEEDYTDYYSSSSNDSVFSGALASSSGGTDNIQSYDISATSVTAGSSVRVTVYTDTDVTKVWVTDSKGDTLSSTTSSTDETNRYKWSLSFTVPESGYYFIHAQSKTGGSGYVRVQIYTDGSSSSSSSSSSTSVSINDHSFSSSSVSYGDTVSVKVYTNNVVRYVWVEDYSGSRMTSSTSYSESGSEYVWTLSFTAYDSGYYYIYVSDSTSSDSNETSEREYITVGN